MLCGTVGATPTICYRAAHDRVAPGCPHHAALQLLMLPNRHLFICGRVNPDPTAEQVAEMSDARRRAVRRFGIAPRVALLSHSNFGSSELRRR
jgi:malate dehydrogenase (oxaloacetate-decarboxylating)(NADP+)